MWSHETEELLHGIEQCYSDKKKPTEWENNFTNYTYNKGPIQKIKLNKKHIFRKTNNSIKNVEKIKKNSGKKKLKCQQNT